VTIGHFSQDVGEMAGRSAVSEVMDGAGPVSIVATELKELEAAMGESSPGGRHGDHRRALRRGARALRGARRLALKGRARAPTRC
jgi:hypothetical protein